MHVSSRVFGPALFFVVLTGCYTLSAVEPVVSLDVWATHFLSWHLAAGHGPWLDGMVIPGIEGHALEHVWVQEAPNGHRTIGRSPGAVIAGIPAYWLFGGSVPGAFAGGLTAAVLTSAAMGMVFLTVRSRLGTRLALLFTGALALTTPLWTVAADGLWPHTITVVGLAGIAWAAHTERWWLLGAFGGVVIWGRLHAAVIVAIVGLGVAWARRSPRVALWVGTVSSGFLGLLCVWSRWMYGSWSPTAAYDVSVFTGYAAQNRFDLVNQLGFWFSGDRGIFIWTPAIVFLLPALVRSWRGIPDWSRWLLIAGVLYTVLQGVLNRYSGGDSFFPYRLGLEFLVCAAPALAFASVDLGRRARLWLGPVLALQFCVMFLGSGLTERLVPAVRDSGGVLPVLAEHPVFGVVGLFTVVVCLGLGPRIVADHRAARAGGTGPTTPAHRADAGL